MFAKINHIAIVSSEYAMLGRFYEALFGMKGAKTPRPTRAVTVRDGYVGLNINPRKPGRPAGLDHFGVEVEDVETVYGRIRNKDETVKWLKRPSNRPFAGITTHDPDGNIFDLSQTDMTNRDAVYVEDDWEQDRYINHYAVRTRRPEVCAEFYADALELTPINRQENDANYYLTDGRVTLMIMPWDIGDYADTGIIRPGPDHIGFKVESVERVKQDIEEISEANFALAPWPVNAGPEGRARTQLVEETCPFGEYVLSDIDGVNIDINE